jgi:hypothetical protein
MTQALYAHMNNKRKKILPLSKGGVGGVGRGEGHKGE